MFFESLIKTNLVLDQLPWSWSDSVCQFTAT